MILFALLLAATTDAAPALPASTLAALVPSAPGTAPRVVTTAPATPSAAPQIIAAPTSSLAPALPASHSAMPAVAAVPSFWRTRAEKSAFHRTADAEETMRFLRLVEAASPWVRIESFGTSGQGRDLPIVIVSKDRAFTPDAARATGKPVVLIQCGIHAGEIEGKDAALAMIRDVTVLGGAAPLLDHAILLVVPMLSIDAHESRSPYHRINQNGPDEMGWRYSPIGLNLNRDYMNAESPEIRALLAKVWTRWWPHLLVDCHTTDGADYQHDMTYGFNHGPEIPPPLVRWLEQSFEARVVPRLTALGHLPAPYLSFHVAGDPASGIDFDDQAARFSNGYAPLQCRPGLLLETHMSKPYETRVRATYDALVALLEEVNAHPSALTGAVAAAESLVVARGRERDPARREVVLTAVLGERAVPFAYRGLVMRRARSEITGASVPHFSATPWDTTLALRRELVPALTVRQPAGYLVPREWTSCADRLDVHGVHYRRFARAWSDSVEVQHVTAWKPKATSTNGHRTLEVSAVSLERRFAQVRPGDLWVPLDQRSALIAIHLFEAQAPDGMMAWNAFDTVFETKEYAEDYVMEPIARRMLAADPQLARDFQMRLRADSAFAASPAERVRWFFDRSAWADPERDIHPVARALRAPPESVLAR